MAKNNSDFLGMGKIFPLLLKLSIPATISSIVAALYNVVDTIFVGQGVGPLAIAALSIAFPIQLLAGAVSHAVGIGAASIISRRLGEKKEKKASETAGTAISAITLFSLTLTTILFIFLKPALIVFGASSSILPYAAEYVSFIALGLFFLSFSLAAGALVRAEGNAKVSMNSMLIGTVLNIILDPIFIFLLGMGIKGAAIATVISQFFSFIYLLLFYLRKKSILPLNKYDFIIRLSVLIDSFILGLPNFVQMAGLSVLIMIINNTLGFYGGDLSISSYGMINRLFSLILMPLFGLAQGFQPIAGYNYGARKYDRVKHVLTLAIISAVVITGTGFLIMMFLPVQLISLFTHDTDLIILTTRNLKIFIIGIPIIGIQLIGSSYFQAVGKKMTSLLLSLSRQFIILIPLIILLPRLFGLIGVWFSFPTSDFIATLITSISLLFEVRHLNEKSKYNKSLNIV